MGDRAELDKGRAACERRDWADAFAALSRADAAAPLGAPDLERLATSAFLLNRGDDYLRTLDRAHQAWAAAGDAPRAARCAFWLALRLELTGQSAAASGWVSRALHLLDAAGADAVERGYLLLPSVERQLEAGDGAAAAGAAEQAARIGERFGDADLVAIGRHAHGRALLLLGETDRGLALLDEAMVAILSGTLSPIVTGLVYCSVIDACMQVHALGRAREWTEALARWCERQSQLVAFTGICLVHRAEVLTLHGDWSAALREARRACERFEAGLEARPPAAALYRQAEVHRLQGRLAEAEAAFREASRWGLEPQPGLALLRLSEGRVATAAAGIRRALEAASGDAERARLLPACIEIACAAGELANARADCARLDRIADSLRSGAVAATAAQARGTVELAAGRADAALAPLRAAFEAWTRLEAPYLAARVRALLARACEARGDTEGAALQRDDARALFESLGAAPDLAALAAATRRRPAGSLTQRELEVLRLVSRGRTTKAIARELRISGKTVDRHLSNLFDKLQVSSRAAAVARAYEQRLI